MFRMGIDLGGTKIEGVVLDKKGNTLFRRRIPTEQDKGYDVILGNITSLYEQMKTHVSRDTHTLGIGTPGALSVRTHLLKNSNTVCMNGKPLKHDLERILGRRIGIQNDANCFAMAEALYGAGRGKDLVFGVIMGTGCGGGIIYKREVITGLQAIAGEWGHMSIDPQGPVCYCGMRGCVETFISGGGLEKRYRSERGEGRSLQEIVAASREGDERAAAFMRTFLADFGRAMGNLINVLDPDIVVLGGGVSNVDELYSDGVRQVEHYVFSDTLETPIVKHQLGDSAGVIGAALIGV